MRPTLASMSHSVLEDHRRMNESIAALESVIRTEASLAGAPRGELAALVVDLRRRLGRHFADEEKGGLFEQIERNAPETADACARLRAPAEAACGDPRRTGPQPGRAASHARRESDVGQLGASVRAVLAKVRAHEEHEDELLLAALEGGKGAPD